MKPASARSKRKRLPTIASLRRKLDKIFSVFIRLRTADDRGIAACVTCQRRIPWKAGNAGHFIKRQHLATRYDPLNCHFQCVQCNLWRGGNLIEYYRFMEKTYGRKVVDDLLALKRSTVKLTRPDFEGLIAKFKLPQVKHGD